MSEEVFGTGLLGEHLAHYASQYYDPEKRRQYYLKTRELKGRPTDGMSDEQKEVWKVSKDSINTERTNKSKEAKTQFEGKLAGMKAKADEAKAAIGAKLAERLAKVEQDIPIPKNATPERRAYLEGQRRKQRGLIQEKFRSEVTKLMTQLRADVKSTREGYKADGEARKKFYDTESTNELEKIKKT